jgi:hypothetical protein
MGGRHPTASSNMVKPQSPAYHDSMAAKSYGRYDDLTPEERKAKLFRTWLETLAWMGLSFLLGYLQGTVPQLTASPVAEAAFYVVYFAVLIRVMILIVRWIALQSPNPNRKPPEN